MSTIPFPANQLPAGALSTPRVAPHLPELVDIDGGVVGELSLCCLRMRAGTTSPPALHYHTSETALGHEDCTVRLIVHPDDRERAVAFLASRRSK